MNDPSELLTTTEAEKIAHTHTRKPTARAIAGAAARGDIKGATKKGKTWLFTRAAFEAWLTDPQMHKPGLSKGQKITRKSK